MLIIVDMQNEYVDIDGNAPVDGAKELVNGILDKIKEYENKGEAIFYTINTKIVQEDRGKSDEEWAIRPYGKLKKALKNHNMLKKISYGITAEKAIEIKNTMVNEIDVKSIELVGVETNICVLANGIIFQNVFPDTKIVINSKLCTSSNDLLHSNALDIMNELKMEVI